MEFRIAVTFTDSLARLTGDEQKAVKTTAFDLQLNPANPGMQFHRLDKAKDKNFWSVRVSSDIRIIVHKNDKSLMLCYVNHHDKAYDWAERRKIEVHPKTGAAQLVEIRERIKEIFVPVYKELNQQVASLKQKLFANYRDEDLLQLGVPSEWIKDVKELDEDGLLLMGGHLPAEASEALLEIATGGQPRPLLLADYSMTNEPTPTVLYKRPVGWRSKPADPFAHPDALRRFRVLNDVEELQKALDSPWDKWAIFLHPDQEKIVKSDFSGPARVSGSAGTGKTIVALHRAVFLARSNPNSRILLTTFSGILANALRVKLRRLISSEPSLSERLDIYSINEVGLRFYKSNIGPPNIITIDQLGELIAKISLEAEKHKFSQQFLVSEWTEVVDAWQLKTWDEYRDVRRMGRKTRLPEQQRLTLWHIFEKVSRGLKAQKLLTYPGLFARLTEFISQTKRSPYEYAVVDESQDMSACHLRFLAAMAGIKANALFFAGDLGQRIFQQPFSWKTIGVDIRGRSKTLHVNYRTSHQIRKQADLLLNSEVTDADGNVEQRNSTISVFNGPQPEIRTFASAEAESEFIGNWISELQKAGIPFHEIGVFVRSSNEQERAVNAVKHAKVAYKILDETVEAIGGQVSIGTMHLAKGLEFKAVAVMACDDEVIPLQERIESVTDDADLEEVYNTERHLLYVACTRARDHLLVSGVEPASEFLQDLKI